jgi:hypothetical protein
MELWSNYDEHYGHHSRYCQETVSTLAHDANLVLEQSSYFFKLLYLPAYIMSLLRMKRGLSVRYPTEATHGVNKLLARYFVWEAATLAPELYGTSILGVMRV